MARFSLRSVGLIFVFVFLSSNFPSGANVAPQRFDAPDQIKSLDSVSQADPTQTGSWECVGVNLPDPCRNTLNSVDMVSITMGWAVGEKGAIINWNGTAWQRRLSPTLNSLKSVALVSATLGWAVGENGVILQWNGSSWVQIASPTTQTLYVVKMLSGTNGYAAGNRDTLLHWDGSSWTVVYFGNNPYGSIRSLAVLGNNDLWAGGSAGWISHWNGSSWDINGGGFSNSQITSLSFLSENEGWAVGNGSSGAIYRYKDGVWTDYSPPLGPVGSGFYAVKMISNSDVWIAGVNQGSLGFRHWNGATWETIQGPTVFSSFSLAMVSGTDGWAVGEGGQILRFTNGQWTTYVAPQFAGLNSVSMLTATDGWAVGFGSMGAAISHWDGTTWNNVPKPNVPQLGTLFSVKMFSSTDGWAVGDGGTILRYSSGTWDISYSNPAAGGFQTIDGISTNDVWVANGYITALGQDLIMHWNGGWHQTYISLSDRIDAIKMLSADEGWAVGQNNVVVRRVGSNWSRYTDPNVGGNSIDMISPTDGWIAGGNNFYHWDGTYWAAFPYPTGPNSGLYPLAVEMNSSSDVWAMGTKGIIFHWDGISWRVLPSFNSNNIISISKAENGSLWAVGEYGVTLRFRSYSPVYLELPFTPNPGKSKDGLDSVFSWFDHQYPLLPPGSPLNGKEPIIKDGGDTVIAPSVMRYDGENKLDCVNGRSDSTHYCYSGHNGYDFSLPENTPVYAATMGTIKSYYDSCIGYFAYLTTDDKQYQIRYLHLGKNVTAKSTVATGEQIGSIGPVYPCTSGPHLHFGVYYDFNYDGNFSDDELIDPYFAFPGNKIDPWTQPFLDYFGKMHQGIISNWLWNFNPPTSTVIHTNTTNLLSTSDGLKIEIPMNSVASSTYLSYSIAPDPNDFLPFSLGVNSKTTNSVMSLLVDRVFELSASSEDGNNIPSFLLPVTMTLKFSMVDLQSIDNSTLTLCYWDGITQRWVSIPTIINYNDDYAQANIVNLGLYSLRGVPLAPTPVINSITPSQGINNQDLVITIVGANFSSPVSVYLDKISLQVISSTNTSIKAIIPKNIPSGLFWVGVQNQDGQEVFFKNSFLELNSIFLPLISNKK